MASSGQTNTRPSSSIAAKEIKVLVNNLTAKENQAKPSLAIIAKVNKAISNTNIAKLGNNNGAQTTARWIQSARILTSSNIILTIMGAPIAEGLFY
jgi:hypothetical protein